MTVPDDADAMVLGFDSRKQDGEYPVTDRAGRLIASISVHSFKAAFEVLSPDGRLIASASRHGAFSSRWEATDANGAVLASEKVGGFGGDRVTLADGRELNAGGHWLSRDWELTDSSGAILMASVPTNSAWSFRPDAWLVNVLDPSIGLLTAIVIVEMHRKIVEASRNSSAQT